MIVVDTNVIAFLLLPGGQTAAARSTWRRDPAWAAPLLWRCELRVLATSMWQGHLPLLDANEVMGIATKLMAGGEFDVRSDAVLRLSSRTRCSAYDCEFVALAQELGVTLVTADRQILADFKETAVPLAEHGNIR